MHDVVRLPTVTAAKPQGTLDGAAAALVVTDMSFRNANVFYELGIRHMTLLPAIQIIRKGDVILAAEDNPIAVYLPELKVTLPS